MKRGIMIGLAVAIVIALWLIIAPYLAIGLIVEKQLPTADAIIVLSGSAAYKERTLKAAELYKQGVAQRIFITDDGERGGWSRDERRNMPFVELGRRELVANGVAPESITTLPGQVAGTDQEAKALADEIALRPIGSIVIVTSAYHTRRALRTFEQIAGDRDVKIGIVYAPLGEGSPEPATWWLGLFGWQTVGGEYVKLAVYWVFY